LPARRAAEGGGPGGGGGLTIALADNIPLFGGPAALVVTSILSCLVNKNNKHPFSERMF
jgi:hypothetical protein